MIALPAEIRALQPHEVTVYRSGVSIEFGGQGRHYGFEAFFDNSQSDPMRTVWKDSWPSKKVADQLWYYAENGVLPPPKCGSGN